MNLQADASRGGAPDSAPVSKSELDAIVVKTAGDQPDVLVALNPAALAVNHKGLRKGGLVILDSGAFKEKDIKRAGFMVDPRTDGTLKEFRVLEIDISAQALEVAKPFG